MTESAKHQEALRSLRSQGTCRLLLLSLVTLGIYEGYYIRRQTTVLNRLLPSEERISLKIADTILVVTYVNVSVFLFVSLTGSPYRPDAMGELLWVLSLVFVWVWGLEARARMNRLLRVSPGDLHWFRWLNTVLFSPFYFNYKVNCLNQSPVELGCEDDDGVVSRGSPTLERLGVGALVVFVVLAGLSKSCDRAVLDGIVHSQDLRTAARSFYNSHGRVPSDLRELGHYAEKHCLAFDATGYDSIACTVAGKCLEVSYTTEGVSGQESIYVSNDRELEASTGAEKLQGVVCHFARTEGCLPRSLKELSEYVSSRDMALDLSAYQEVKVKRRLFGRVRVNYVMRPTRSGRCSGSIEFLASEIQRWPVGGSSPSATE